MPPQDSKPRRFNIFYILILAWVLVFFYDYYHYKRNLEALPYSDFLAAVEAGNVAEVSVNSTAIQGELKAAPEGKSKFFSTVRIEDPGLIDRLRAQGVKFRGMMENTLWKTALSWVLPIVVMLIIWKALFSRFSQGAAGGMLPLGKSKAKVYVEKDLKVTFQDVAGVDEAKEELKEVVDFLREPERFTVLGGRVPKGILLIGPPGTGKTMLAKAVAGEAKVPFFSINGSEFVEMFVGLGAARVRDLFEQARKQSPCIIFIDELDALGKSRALGAPGTGSNDEKEQTLNQLLAELDGFDASVGVVLLGSTNRPEVLDPALLRSGRFDRQILVDRPDRGGRIQILKVHAKKIRMDPSVNLEAVASLTAGFSGADLANLVNEAALSATRRRAKAVFQQDFTAAMERIVAGLERKSRVMSQEEKRRVAFHEMGHATVGLALKPDERVHKVSIIPRGVGALGYTLQRPLEDRYLMEKEELLRKISVLLGGRAAEAMYFKDISTGAHDDLSRASDLARAMVTQYGMSDKLGLLTYEKPASPFLRGPQEWHEPEHFSESTARVIDEESRRIMERAYDLAVRTLRDKHVFYKRAVAELLARETLTEEEIARLWREYAQAPEPLRATS